jgi:hypothetical protein
LTAARTAKILTIKTSAAKAGEPSSGKIKANVFRNVAAKFIYGRNYEQHAGDVTDYKKPEYALATAKVAPAVQVVLLGRHRAAHIREAEWEANPLGSR